jgi:hypothetical protein
MDRQLTRTEALSDQYRYVLSMRGEWLEIALNLEDWMRAELVELVDYGNISTRTVTVI